MAVVGGEGVDLFGLRAGVVGSEAGLAELVASDGGGVVRDDGGRGDGLGEFFVSVQRGVLGEGHAAEG